MITDPDLLNLLPLASVRFFKGAPLSCLISMLIQDRPVTFSWLSTVTGYNEREISNAMFLLHRFHLIRPLKSRRWELIISVSQLDQVSQPSIINPN